MSCRGKVAKNARTKQKSDTPCSRQRQKQNPKKAEEKWNERESSKGKLNKKPFGCGRKLESEREESKLQLQSAERASRYAMHSRKENKAEYERARRA